MRDLKGNRFGRLVVIRFLKKHKTPNGSGKYYWVCKCDCGQLTNTEAGHLLSGHKRSCSCLQKDITSKRNFKHGLTRHPIYTAWCNMFLRCYNPKNTSYPWYGAKGIRVCKRWKDFKNFLADMGATWSKGLELDRWPNRKGDYDPSNCRWVTHYQQLRNYGQNRWFKFKGLKLTICDWSKKLGGSHSLVRDRICSGWDLQRALTTPARSHKR
jgi:hypothetical protein